MTEKKRRRGRPPATEREPRAALVVRLTPAMHEQLGAQADSRGVSMNAVVAIALRRLFDAEPVARSK
jgi:predicted HicB family RNase H-like nuclease